MQNEKAFIAANKFFTKERLPFGVGVIGSFDEEIAKKDTIRQKKLETENSWFEINIPSRDTFLILDSQIASNPETVQNCLFSKEALAMLFFDEGNNFFTNLNTYLASKPEEERALLAEEELNLFYTEKKEKLLQHTDIQSLFNYITEKSKPKDIAIASSFLSRFGITGVIFSENNNEKFLIFDAKKNIHIKKSFFKSLE